MSQPIYVEVAVNVPQVSGVFHYHLPEEFEKVIQVGHLVVVPFGPQEVQGVILRFVETPDVTDTRPVHDLLDEIPVVTKYQIKLAREMAERTLNPLAAWIGLMLPPGLSQTAEAEYQLTEQARKWIQTKKLLQVDLSDAQMRLLQLLKKRGPLRSRQIGRALPYKNWESTARALVRKGLVSSESVLRSPTVSAKVVRTVELAVSPEEARGQWDDLARKGTQALGRRQKIIEFLIREGKPVQVSWVYAESGGNLSDLKQLAKKGLVLLGETETWRDPLDEITFVAAVPPILTKAQVEVWEDVSEAIETCQTGNSPPPILLHGVTGSGKTEIYLRAVQKTLERGKQAIILVPEIALTPQTVRRFMARFEDQVGLVHSQLSSGERYDTWRRARLGLISVVVGPRSALFTPFHNLGLIVLDESHDDSYYQSEPMPSYHARDTAVQYAKITNSVCLMGSATPDVTSAYRAKAGAWTYLRLPDRILAHKETIRQQLSRYKISNRRYITVDGDAQTTELPPIQVVDMRNELHAGNRSIFSRALQSELHHVIENDQQAILFLNRRGKSTYVFCRDCGHSMKCPQCDIPLTYHSQSRRASSGALICHRCGYSRRLPRTCPNCGSERIRQYGTGTQKVEQELEKMFPELQTLRWDWDTTRRKGAHDLILSQFANQQADVLIGTQMLAKGLDLPKVTLVGVILADVGLNLPDYRSPERTFQTLLQVSGRAGRSPLGGQVVLQTFEPDHYVIQNASEHDYDSFYRKELEYRREIGYPPFARLVRLLFKDVDPKKVERSARKADAILRHRMQSEGPRQVEIIGPVPCFFSRIGGVYRWQIVLRGNHPAEFLRNVKIPDCSIEVDPPTLL